jgi:predicted transport protein
VSDLKLFRLIDGDATELRSSSVALEKSLQTVIERNMETLFGVRLLASEFSTGVKHGGRMDSLGIDENYSPVIFEYKRAINENVINQGLFYLDWLMDHRGDFKVLVQDRLGPNAAPAIDWRNPRLICVANGFTKYDEYAVQQINRSIELVRYRDFGGEFLALELITSTKLETATSEGAPSTPGPSGGHAGAGTGKTVSEYLEQSAPDLRDMYFALEAFCEGLGDDVTKRVQKNYFAFRRLKNFACVEVHPQTRNLLVYLKVHPESIQLEKGFSRDVRSIGHFGTGDLELRIKNAAELAKAQPLIQRSYEES